MFQIKKLVFDSNFNEVTIFYKNNKQEKLHAKTKALISEEIVKRINNHLN
jgi:phosphopantothenoylcysteine decarboxylase/phosphopantothenate--cysteine ligase